MESATLTREQCRELDRRAMEEFGIPGLVLMENAGRGCVDVLERLGITGPVVIFCGKGNNAGDGFVIARHLDLRGHSCRVLMFGPPEDLHADAAANFAILKKCGVPIFDVSSLLKDELRDTLDKHSAGASWFVDAMLGTGAVGEPRPPFDAAIDWINSRRKDARVLAVDLPSGLDCNTGELARHTVRADHTCTFAGLKVGFENADARPFLGMVRVCDIGVPSSLIDAVLKA
jgi:NAD(P)H-hydrate epimerase